AAEPLAAPASDLGPEADWFSAASFRRRSANSSYRRGKSGKYFSEKCGGKFSPKKIEADLNGRDQRRRPAGRAGEDPIIKRRLKSCRAGQEFFSQCVSATVPISDRAGPIMGHFAFDLSI